MFPKGWTVVKGTKVHRNTPFQNKDTEDKDSEEEDNNLEKEASKTESISLVSEVYDGDENLWENFHPYVVDIHKSSGFKESDGLKAADAYCYAFTAT